MQLQRISDNGQVVLRIHFKADPKPEDMQMKFLGNETMTDATALDVNSVSNKIVDQNFHPF